jgi:hypothetical protein
MPRDAKPFDGWSLRTSVTVLRSLVRAIAVMLSKLIMRFVLLSCGTRAQHAHEQRK